MGDHMNWKKKTEYITFRATEEVKEALRAEAEEHKWSISQLVEQIVSEWLTRKARRFSGRFLAFPARHKPPLCRGSL